MLFRLRTATATLVLVVTRCAVAFTVLLMASLVFYAAPFLNSVCGALHRLRTVRTLVTTGAVVKVWDVLMKAPLSRLKHDTIAVR